MDTTQRQLERAATDGDIDAEARALRARVRAFPVGWALREFKCEICPGAEGGYILMCPECADTGLVEWPVQSRLELAAYAGSAAARMFVPHPSCCAFHVFKPSRKSLPCRLLPTTATQGFEAWLSGLSRWPHAVSVRAACAAAEVAREAYWYRPEATMDTWKRAGDAIQAAHHWCDVQTEEAREAWRRAWGRCRPADRCWIPTPQTKEQAPRIQAAARLTSVRAAICIELKGYALA